MGVGRSVRGSERKERKPSTPSTVDWGRREWSLAPGGRTNRVLVAGPCGWCVVCSASAADRPWRFQDPHTATYEASEAEREVSERDTNRHSARTHDSRTIPAGL
jgi:hypothetical protein